MIGFFTDPYPDELLYSALARYSQRAKYPNRNQILQEIFGNQSVSAIFDFPTRLNDFLSSLHKENLYSGEYLINENSLLPFYEPFLPIDRANLIRREMGSSTNNKIHVRLGIRVGQIKNPDYVRFCSPCVKDDRKEFGETYWHRIHQLSGILVCPKHKCFLENSKLKWDRQLGYQFHSAERLLKATSPIYIDRGNQIHQILLKIAKDAEWLLSQKNLCLGTEVLQQRYFNLLLRQGFAYYNGNIKHTKFIQACQEYFSSELFEMVGRLSKRDNWLSALIRLDKIGVTFHPIRHLLLMTFLEFTAKEFFTSFVEYKPFSEPPYPCLNKAAEHYREMRIKQCQVFDNLSKDDDKKGRPLAVFTCDCGFIYQRIGPDKSEEDKFTVPGR